MNLSDRTINNKYNVIRKIGEGGMSTVWLAEDMTNKRNVAIKFLKRGVISNRVEDLIRFKNEAVAISKLNVPNIIKIYEIGEFEGQSFLVIEYFEGQDLQDLIGEGSKFEIEDAVDIIYKLSEALKNIHNCNIIHRDLKPGNVMVNCKEENGSKVWDVKLIDFGLAQVKEFNIKDTDQVVGTLCYIAPEQSGVMNRSIDERSDLYSLGIMFYQLLTGQLPFKVGSVSSIVHQHIAKIPEPPSVINASVPPVLGKMALKLLEKEQEKRYQSAEGFISDLKKYHKGEINFELGLDDKFVKLNFRTRLVGREDELNKLKLAVNNASDEQGGIYLISGETGRGKTRLVEELKEYIYQKKGTFIDGKCFSGKTKIPYGPFKDALNIFVRNYNKYPQDKKEQIKDTIKENIGDLGEIVLKLAPVMKEIIGDCRPLVELEKDRENKRFLMVLNQFFYSLGKAEGFIVVLLDDIHWMDEGSFEILNELIREISKYPLLVIGTYRDNEIVKGHSLRRFIKNAVRNGSPFAEIHLQSFDIKKMNKMISGLLFDSESNCEEISGFVLKKSKGNPYFAIEILKQLVDEKAIIRNAGRWYINKDILDNIKISSTVVDILIKKISLLSKEEVEVLSFAAVAGRKFDIDLIFELSGIEKEDIIAVIDKVAAMQLLEEDAHEKGVVSFVHDRISEAFYRNINDARKKELHLKIAQTLERLHENEIEKVVFHLANHYVEGGSKEKAMEYAYPAGIKAKENYAFDDAVKYLMYVVKMLEENGEEGCEKWEECLEIVGDIYSTSGKIDEAIEVFNRILPFVSEKVKKANILKQISHTYYRKGDWASCEDYVKKGLKLLGERLPVKNTDAVFCAVKNLIVFLMYNIFEPYFLKRKPSHNNEKYKQVLSFYYVVSWSYLLSNVLKVFNTTLRVHNLAVSKMGKSKELAFGISTIAGLMSITSLYNALPAKFLHAMSAKYHEKGYKIKDELGDEWGIAQSCQWMGYLYEFKGEYDKSISLFTESLNIYKRIGDIKEYNMSLNGVIHDYFYLSDYNNMKIVNSQLYENSVRAKDNYVISASYIYSMQRHIEMGDFDGAEYYGAKCNNVCNKEKDLLNYCTLCMWTGVVNLYRGDVKKSLEYVENAKYLNETNNLSRQYTAPIYYHIADAYISEYMNISSRMVKRERKAYLSKIKAASMEALKKTKNMPSHYGGALRVTAKYLVLASEFNKAEASYLKSIGHCREFGRKYELAMGFYEYGLFLDKMERKEEARVSFESAYNIFKEIESKYFERITADYLGIVYEAASTAERFTQELRYNQRLSSIIKLSQDISSILNLDELLEKVMSIAVEVTGAQRGYLMIRNDRTGEISINARKNMNENQAEIEYFSRSIVNEVMKSGRPILTTNAMEDEKYHTYDSVIYNELKSIICMPIIYNNQIKGVCYIDNPLSSSVFTEEDMDILNVIMAQAAISIENAQLYQMAITDGLTGATTHKHFKYVLRRDLEQAARYNDSLSLIMFDIDNFKKFNDTYGHQAGDKVLCSIYKISKDIVRNIDTLARYGGEEFAIILPETDIVGAEAAAERIRKAVENTEVMYEGNNLKVTVSLGVASFPVNASDGESLIKAADNAMYGSKQNGKNRVTVSCEKL